MKIRNGFVSNSSSSSFIVVWDKKPQSIDEIKNILFGELENLSVYGDSIDTIKLSETIFSDTDFATYEQIKSEQDSLFQFNTWESTPKWDSVGYYANKKLMDIYEKEYIDAKYNMDFYEDILKTYSVEEKNSFIRQGKLERVLGMEMSKREKDFYEATKLKRKYQDIYYGNSKIMEQIVKESTDKFIEDHKDKYISIYEYSDNDGNLGSTLEHGDVFNNLKSWQISHH